MTIIVWDGKTMAADKQTNDGNQKIKCTKIFKWNGHLLGGAGSAALIELMFKWFKDGAEQDEFPDSITTDSDEDCHLLVITPDAKIMTYENCSYPQDYTENKVFALGCGSPYAYAAMSMGADAYRAVEVTCEHDSTCGMGIDTLTLG